LAKRKAQLFGMIAALTPKTLRPIEYLRRARAFQPEPSR